VFLQRIYKQEHSRHSTTVDTGLGKEVVQQESIEEAFEQPAPFKK
jgi:hypothetical protein